MRFTLPVKTAMIAGWLFTGGCAGAPSGSSTPGPQQRAVDTDDGSRIGKDTPAISNEPSPSPESIAEPQRTGDELQQDAPVTSAWVRNSAPDTAADEETGIPPGLVAENIATTGYSALVHIEAGRVDDPEPGFGYVNHVYRGRVLETFRGEVLETVTYAVMADRDAKLFLPGYPVIVSLCGDGERRYVPDNGYVLPATSALLKAARRAGRTKKKSRGASACGSDAQ